MEKLKSVKLFGGLSLKSWLIALSLVFYVFVYICSYRAFLLMMFGLLMPVIAFAAIDLHRSRPYAGTLTFRLMVAAALWSVFSTVVNWRVDMEWVLKYWFVTSCWLYFAFAARDAGWKEIKQQLLSAGIVLICGYLPLALLALVSVFTGRVIRVPFLSNPVGIQTAGKIDRQVFVLFNPNSDGRITMYCILMAIFGCLSCRRKGVRVFNIIVILVNLMLLAHTQSRTCFIGLAAGLALLSFRALYLRFVSLKWRIPAGLLVAVLVFFAVLGGLKLIYNVDVATARALSADHNVESAVPNIRVELANQFDMLTSGRGNRWLYSFKYLKEHPRYLLTGMGGTVKNAFNKVYKVYSTEIGVNNGFHNSYLATVAIGGIPLLVIMLAYLCKLFLPCLRLYLRPATEESRGFAVVPVFIFVLLITNVTENGLFCGASYVNLLFFLLCGIAFHADRLARGEG